MKKYFILAALFSMFAFSSAYADWNNGGGGHPGFHGNHAYFHYNDHPHWGVHVHNFYPQEYYPVWVGGAEYYYDDGVYYNYAGGDYVVAQPPMGAVVSTIPNDFQPVIINGTTYYTDNGVYYIYTSSGYKVATPPQAANVFIVNVPHVGGGYVKVTLRRSGSGYVGPQGEFYPAFPKISQLKAMYGK